MYRIRRTFDYALIDWDKVDQYLCKEAQAVESVFKEWSNDQEGEWKISASVNNRRLDHYLDVRVWMEGEGAARSCVAEQFRLAVIVSVEEDKKLDQFFKQLALSRRLIIRKVGPWHLGGIRSRSIRLKDYSSFLLS